MKQVQILLTLLVAVMLQSTTAQLGYMSQDLKKVYEKNVTLIDPNSPDKPTGFYLHFGEYTKTVNRTMLKPADSTAPDKIIPVREFHFNLYLKPENLQPNTKIAFGIQFRPEWSSKLDQANSGGRLLQGSQDAETYKRLMPMKDQNTYWDGFVWQFTYDQTSTQDAKMTVKDTWSTKQVSLADGKLANIELDAKPEGSDKKVQNWLINLAKTEVTCENGNDCLIRGHAKREFFSNDRQDWDLWPGWYELYNMVGFYEFEPVGNPGAAQAYVGPTMMIMLSAKQLLIGTAFAVGAITQLI